MRSMLAACSKNRTRPLGPPISVALGITGQCNYRCLYCDVWRRENKGELGTEQWKAILNELADWLGPTHVSFAGGEPFLRRDLEEIVSFAYGLGFLPSVVTNGAALTADLVQQVTRWPLASLILSIDSLSPEPHDTIHGAPGAHARVMSAAKEFVRHGFGQRLRVATVLTGMNLDEIAPLARWAAETDIGGFTVQPLGEPFDRPHDDDWYAVSPLKVEDPAHVAQVVHLLHQGKTQGWPVLNPNRQLQALPEYYRDPEQGMFLPCLVGSTTLGIGPQGELRFCPYLPAFGRYGQVGLRTQWFGIEAARLRRSVLRCKRGCSIMNCNFNPSLGERIRRWQIVLRNGTSSRAVASTSGER